MLKNLGAWLCCVGIVQAQTFDELLQQAEAKLRLHDPSGALTLADAAVKEDGGRWDGHFVRASALLVLGRASEALVSAVAAGSQAPSDRKDDVLDLIERCKQASQRVALLLRDAEAAWNQGLDDLAARRFAAVFDIDPSQVGAGLKAAELWVGLEQYAAAGKLLRCLREDADGKVREQALGLSQKIREALAEPLRAHLEEARAALREDEREVAKALLAEVEALTDDGEAHYLAAKLAAREGKLVDALQHLRAAKFARFVNVGMIRRDADMTQLVKDPAAAEWIRNAFGAGVAEALASPAPQLFTATVPPGWTRKHGSPRWLHHTFSSHGEVYVLHLASSIRGSLDVYRAEMGQSELSDTDYLALPRVPMLTGDGVLLDVSGDHSTRWRSLAGARLLVVARQEGDVALVAKLVGNAAEVETQRQAFLKFCASLRRSR